MNSVAQAVVLLAGAAGWLCAQESAAPSSEAAIGWKWANFAILAAGLAYLASKTLPAFFRSRTQAIQRGIAEAQQIKRDAEQRAADMSAKIGALGAEIERFRKQAQAEMEQEGARIRGETARAIEKLQTQAEQEIESAGKAARRELRTYAAKLALELAEQRVRARLDDGTETGLVDAFVHDLQRQESRN